MGAPDQLVVDWDVFVENRNRLGPDDLLPYAGEWLAWSLDGSQLIAHHRNAIEADRLVRELGLTASDVLWEHLPDADTIEVVQ